MKPAETSIEPTTRAETERLEREEARKEREAEAAVINAIVEKSNALIDRMNLISAQRIEVRYQYGDATLRFELDRTEERCTEARSLNIRLLELDREHWTCSKEFARLEGEYITLSKAYDDKWTSTWGGILGATALMSGVMSKLIGGYLTTSAAKKTP